MTTQEELQARQLLADFIEWVESFLRGMILNDVFYVPQDSVERRPIMAREARAALVDAWRQFEADFHDGQPRKRIENSERQHLITHGLYGAQLQAKLRLVAMLALRVDQLFRQTDQILPGQLQERQWFQSVERKPTAAEARPRRRGGFIKGIKDLIGGIDVFADSIIEATGIGGAIREIKELFGMSLDDE